MFPHYLSFRLSTAEVFYSTCSIVTKFHEVITGANRFSLDLSGHFVDYVVRLIDLPHVRLRTKS
jgi:hypothetical protein